MSTEEQAIHGLSVETQMSALGAWAEGHTIVDYYVDRGVSARKPASARPELQRLLRDVRAGKVDLIAFTKLDRWFRNIAEYYKVQEVLDEHNTAWRAISEDYETETASGRFKVNIMLSVAQDEADRTSERIKFVFDGKRERGEPLNQHSPIGVSIVDKAYVPNEKAPAVKKLFEHYANTRSLYAVSKDSAEILGVHYTQSGVSGLLSNRVYVRLGIVSEELFTKVKEIRAVRAQRCVPRTGRTYMLSGILVCGTCGRKMAGQASGSRIRYRCGVCGRTVGEHRMEGLLVERLAKEIGDYNLRIGAEKKKDPAPILRKMDKLTDLYLSDLIERGRYEKEYRECQEELSRIRTSAPINEGEVISALDGYHMLTRENKKAFWSRVLRRVVVSWPLSLSFDFFVA